MAHDRTQQLQALADGQLGPLRRFLLARHVARCPRCAAQLDSVQAMSNVLRTRLPLHRAPPGLAARIGASLPAETPPPLPQRPWFRLPALRFAGTGLAGALAGAALTVLLIAPPAGSDAVNSVIGSHIRSLQADHLMDVVTSDQHTVKPWLSARVDVSPPVKQLADAGFPLLGGRLDYVDGHRAAALVYRRAKHLINLFAWASPGRSDTDTDSQSRQGFNVITWRHDGITYYAVSDVEADQLAEFVRLVRGS